MYIVPNANQGELEQKRIGIGAETADRGFLSCRTAGSQTSRYLYRSGGSYSGAGAVEFQSNKVWL